MADIQHMVTIKARPLRRANRAKGACRMVDGRCLCRAEGRQRRAIRDDRRPLFVYTVEHSLGRNRGAFAKGQLQGSERCLPNAERRTGDTWALRTERSFEEPACRTVEGTRGQANGE